MLNKIKELCKANGITVKELEEKAGLADRSIYKWGTEEKDVMPSAKNLMAVAKELGTTVEYLLGE